MTFLFMDLIFLSMARKKRTGGLHKTERRAVQFPLAWFEVAQQLARMEKPSPTIWYLVALVKEKAEAAGITNLPPLPWESETK